MVTPEELISQEDYDEILLDIREECEKYGPVEGLRIPRPVPRDQKWNPGETAAQQKAHYESLDEKAGVGKVWVLFKDINGAVSLGVHFFLFCGCTVTHYLLCRCRVELFNKLPVDNLEVERFLPQACPRKNFSHLAKHLRPHLPLTRPPRLPWPISWADGLALYI